MHGGSGTARLCGLKGDLFTPGRSDALELKALKPINSILPAFQSVHDPDPDSSRALMEESGFKTRSISLAFRPIGLPTEVLVSLFDMGPNIRRWITDSIVKIISGAVT